MCKLNDLKTSGKKDDLLAKLNEVEVTKELNSLSHFEVTVRYLELKNNKPHTDITKTPASTKRKASTPASSGTAATEMEDEEDE